MTRGLNTNTRLSHADLLTLYLQQPTDFLQLAGSLGFEKKHQKKQNNQQKAKPTSDKPSGELDTHIEPKEISQMTDRPALPFFYIAKRERTENHLKPAKLTLPTWFTEAEVLTEDEIYDQQAKQPQLSALTRAPLLWMQLSQIIRRESEVKQPDVARLVTQIAKGQTIKKVPYLQRKRRISQILILADNAKHLKTARLDYQTLYQECVKQWGKQNVQWQSIVDQPMGSVNCVSDTVDKTQAWQVPSPDTAVIILSDCGRLGKMHTQQAWQQLLTQLYMQKRLTVVLSLTALLDLQSLNIQSHHVFSWDKRLAKKSKRQQLKKVTVLPDYSADVATTLTYLCFSYRIESGLLRAIRSQLGFNVSVEASCRLHSDVVDDGVFLYIKATALDHYRERFKQLTQQQQKMSVKWVRAYHAPLPRAILDQELLNAQVLCSFKIDKSDESLINLQRLSKTFSQKSNDHLLRCWSYAYLQEQESGKELAAAFFASYYQEEIEQGELEGITLPRHVQLHDLQPFIALKQENKVYNIQQRENTLRLQVLESPASSGFTLAKIVFSQKQFKHKNQLISVSEGTELVMRDDNKITIDTGTEKLTISRLIKPEWAQTIGRDKHGLFIEYQQKQRLQRVYYPSYGGQIEKDDMGLYLDITLQNITQRFRYIPPGKFLMGSPISEEGRETWSSKETQHEVTLTQGFWLADTTVTQAFYQAVMGESPSHFKSSNDLPVEQVSWDDAQEFISRLNQLIPELTAQLPSEAQWEYACRAGTETAFSWGDNIIPEQVNYNGSKPYLNAKAGLYRKKTVEVKSLPANQWGLYEMHGNVWEWCSDEYKEDLGQHAVVDPLESGSETSVDRVLCGGSWGSYGRDVRSAIRYRNGPGNRSYRSGFRFSLGLELQPSQEQADVQQSHSRRDVTKESDEGLDAGLLSKAKKFL